ncbi:hypothetical protein FQZ97_901510 [compost metagenome]
MAWVGAFGDLVLGERTGHVLRRGVVIGACQVQRAHGQAHHVAQHDQFILLGHLAYPGGDPVELPVGQLQFVQHGVEVLQRHAELRLQDRVRAGRIAAHGIEGALQGVVVGVVHRCLR